jgi:phosphoribosylformylglycinamidine (FGAM) synthase-like amidotransferase family enzyme
MLLILHYFGLEISSFTIVLSSHKTEVAAKEMAYENMYRQTKIAYRYLHSDSKTTNSEVDWHENNSLKSSRSAGGPEW